MIIYLAVLALITAGASTGLFSLIQTGVSNGRMGLYDAKGYWVLSMLMLTFLIASLAYFWGATRFVAATGTAVGAATVTGMLFAVFGCLAALGVGLVRLAYFRTSGSAEQDGIDRPGRR